MNVFQGIVLGLVQGLTEFIPVSSSAHLIIIRQFLHINNTDGLAFDAVLQLATVLAVLVYFWKDLWNLLKAFILWLCGKGIESNTKNLILAIIVGTIPALVLGLLLEKYMETTFRTVALASLTLVLGSIIFFVAEWYVKKRIVVIEGGQQTISVKKGFFIGLFQSLALIPGMSRSGMTISGGLFLGLSREWAAKFSFLLSFPIIFGSGLKKLLDIVQTGEVGLIGIPLIVGSVVAFASGLAAIHFLITFLRKHSLIPFAIYRVVLAVLLLIFAI